MPRSLSLLLLAPLLAVAAPVPKDVKATIEKKFGGKVVDPKGDSTFDLDGDKLTITLPAGEERRFGYTVDVDDPKNNKKYKKFDHTPKVEFTQTGDFTLIVRVRAPLVDGAKMTERGEGVDVGGGVTITPKDGQWYRYGVSRSPGRKGEVTNTSSESPRIWTNGGAGGNDAKLKGAEAVWVYVGRKGRDLECGASADGKEWVGGVGFVGACLDDTVTLALYADHCSDTKHTVTFDEFQIETPKK